MRKDIKIQHSLGSRAEYKRKFTLAEMYRAFVLIPDAMFKMIKNRIGKTIDKNIIERLHLAVTEVNGCAACSYAHSHMAMKQGMSKEEIHSFLSGDGAFINEDEAKAILFAQHYADTGAFPKKDAYDSLLDEYGAKKTKIIISAIQIMQAGNIYGIPFSAFISRLRGKPYKDSSLIYELGMQIAGLVFLPFALIQGLLRCIAGSSNIRLDNSISNETGL